MKRLILCVCIVAVIVCLCLGGCSFMGDAGQSNPENNKIEVTVYVDDIPVRYKVSIGEQLTIEPPIKNGYAFEKATDVDGKEIINSNCQSTSVWTETMPTELYAQFINASDATFTYSNFTSDALKVNYPGKGFRIEFSTQFVSAIKGNLDREVNVKVTYNERGTSYPFLTNTLTFSYGSHEETLFKTSYSDRNETYVKRTHEFVVNTNDLRSGDFFLKFETTLDNIPFYIKDLKIIVNFCD